MLPLFLACLCLALIAYTFAGYAVVMACLARLRPRPWKADPAASDAEVRMGLSLVLCAHDTAERIQARVQNLIDCEWEGPRQVVVFCDGCNQVTLAALRAFSPSGVEWTLCESATRVGKAQGLNTALAHCRYPLVVLCDLRQRFAPDALTHLANPFADPQVGAVSGLLEIASSSSGSGQGVDLYWRLETRLRHWESQVDSVIGCTGAICAIRRDLFQPLPADTLLDDVIIPMRIAESGYRVIYEPRARAFDPQTLDPQREKGRKLRTLVGNFQMLERHPEWLLPWRCRLWWQLLSHKYLRLLVPWWLGLVAGLSVFGPAGVFFTLLRWGQLAAYGLAVTGLALPRLRLRIVTVPAGFLQLQISALTAFFAFLSCRSDYLRLWRTAPSSPMPPPPTAP
jgi:cellulose synthase/poly-beta-1,6-N-acetylglucosamine synthase-like glycosyltransferase